RDGEVQLEVAPGVPRERADAVAWPDPEVRERRGQTPNPLAELLVARAVGALRGLRDDPAATMERLRAVEDPREDEVVVLHEAAHDRDSRTETSCGKKEVEKRNRRSPKTPAVPSRTVRERVDRGQETPGPFVTLSSGGDGA